MTGRRLSIKNLFFNQQDDLLSLLYEGGVIRETGFYLGRFFSSLDPGADLGLVLAAALYGNALEKKEVCLDLVALANKTIFEAGDGKKISTPPLSSWRSHLFSCSTVGSPGQKKPLVLDDRNRLYFYRYWDYERRTASRILEMASQKRSRPSDTDIKNTVARLFPDWKPDVNGAQVDAAIKALQSRFCLISGGPGTGKTYTLARIILLFEEFFPGLKMALAAPTGKAAARLMQSLLESRRSGDAAPFPGSAVKDAMTIHRLLGAVYGSSFFKYSRKNPLPYDLVVVDEASMIDLALMTRLIDALKPDAGLLLVGDRYQLSSVEPGSVLSDIYGEYDMLVAQGKDVRDFPLLSSIAVLDKNYRFGKGAIPEITGLVKEGAAERVIEILDKRSDVSIIDPDEEGFEKRIERMIIEGYSGLFSAANPGEALERLKDFRILCVINEGPWGVDRFNAICETLLVQNGFIDADNDWYPGRPVLITRNDYSLELYNGDIGITMPRGNGGELFVFFEGRAGEIRYFSPSRLADCKPVYAMTVHKSQGSEFSKVLLVLPDRENPVLTRELVYTGMTRARKELNIVGRRRILSFAITRQTIRSSGLKDMLWSGGRDPI